MLRPCLLVFLVVAACGRETPPPASGPFIYVLFDERHGLEGGEAVRLHEFEIGVVEEVDLHRARVRAKLRLEPDVLSQLTIVTTFSVASSNEGRFLQTHVLDPEAPVLEEGDTVEGVDSSLELTLRQWGGGIDWEETKEEMGERWDEWSKKLEELAGKGYEEAEKGLKELAEELEKAGESEEAQKLRERFKELWGELTKS